MPRYPRSAHVEANDSSFVMFGFVIVLGIVIPWAILLLKRGIWSFFGWNKLPIVIACTCPNCDKLKKEWKKKLSKAWLTKSYFVQLFIVVGLAYLAVCMNRYLVELKENQSFDPYEILGIDPYASEKEIKQAYRNLTIKMHPDKNPGDPQASSKFLRLTNAYRSLTDPQAKQNYLKYGNPDGPTPFSIGIPLPAFMSNTNNGVMTLIILFVIVLFVLPGFGYCLYAMLYNKNKYKILSSNEDKLRMLMNHKVKEANVPEIIANADEFKWYLKPKMKPECENIGKELGIKAKDPLTYKPQVLIQAFINNIPINDEETVKDQKFVLKTSARVISYLADLSLNDPSILEILKFSQRLYQQLKPNESPMMQLPYMTKEIIDKLRVSSFKDYISLTPEKRNLTSIFSESQAKDIEAAIKTFPKLDLEISCEVKGSREIYQGDVLTINIKGTIERQIKDSHKDSTEDANYAAHSNKYPLAKKEILWLIIFSDKLPDKYMSFRISKKAETFTKSLNTLAITVFCLRCIDWKNIVYSVWDI